MATLGLTSAGQCDHVWGFRGWTHPPVVGGSHPELVVTSRDQSVNLNTLLSAAGHLLPQQRVWRGQSRQLGHFARCKIHSSCFHTYPPVCTPQCSCWQHSGQMKPAVASGPSPPSCWPPGPQVSQGLLGFLERRWRNTWLQLLCLDCTLIYKGEMAPFHPALIPCTLIEAEDEAEPWSLTATQV